MGNTLSPSARKYGLLIGDLSDDMLSEEKKLYGLSKYVLDKDISRLNTADKEVGFKVLDTYQQPVGDSRNKLRNGTDSNVAVSEQALTSRTVVSSGGSDTRTDFSLFSLLTTDKPYYFSQTFTQWLTLHRYSNLLPLPCCQNEKRTIYIQPVDNFPSFITEFEIDLEHFNGNHDFFSATTRFMEAFFDEMDIVCLPNVNILEAKWKIKTRFHHKTANKQYFVQDFFLALRKVMPSDGFCIMGISWTDLYPTEKLNFVLGEAHYSRKSGIFCFGRYEPKSYDPGTHQDISQMDAKLFWRVLKVITHETCHLFGLQHCWYYQCSMNESNSMVEAAAQPIFLCPVCLRKLQYVCGFNIVNRYKRLLAIMRDICKTYPSSDFLHAVEWLEKCLLFLQTEQSVT